MHDLEFQVLYSRLLLKYNRDGVVISLYQ